MMNGNGMSVKVHVCKDMPRDALDCYGLMADLCALLDPDGDPEPEA